MEQEIGSAAGRINGAYGEADWTPIRYVNRAYSHSTLAGLYRAARVGLVTPLRDGTNLVAKEYVASQNPDDPGVLILWLSLAQLINAQRRCWSILTIRTASRPLLDRRSRCRWPAARAARRAVPGALTQRHPTLGRPFLPRRNVSPGFKPARANALCGIVISSSRPPSSCRFWPPRSIIGKARQGDGGGEPAPRHLNRKKIQHPFSVYLDLIQEGNIDRQQVQYRAAGSLRPT